MSTSFFQIVYYAIKPLCFVCACFFSCHTVALPTTFFVFYVCIVFFCCYIIPPVACTFARFAVSNCVTVVRFPISNVFCCFCFSQAICILRTACCAVPPIAVFYVLHVRSFVTIVVLVYARSSKMSSVAYSQHSQQ